MTDLPPAFPLQWPTNWPRRRHNDRKNGRFSTSAKPITIAGALNRLQTELERIGARYAVISSNLEPRRDGLPRSGQREPEDPGIAVYFLLDGKPHCLPCDTYTQIAQNIAAIAAHIEAA